MKVLHRLLLVGMLLSVVLLVACSGEGSSVETVDEAVMDIADLVDQLETNGATVATTGTIAQPFFTPQGQIIAVNGQDVQVFEYAGEAAASAEADLVSPDGSSVGTSIMSWLAPPHFYHRGWLIVLYVGDDSGVIDALERVLGPQFAGAQKRPLSTADDVPGAGVDHA